MKRIWDEDIPGVITWTREHLKNNEIPTLFIQYKEAVKYPKATALMIEDFLGVVLNIENMVKAVDRNARTRYKTEPELDGFNCKDQILRVDAETYKEAEVSVYHVGDVP